MTMLEGSSLSIELSYRQGHFCAPLRVLLVKGSRQPARPSALGQAHLGEWPSGGRLHRSATSEIHVYSIEPQQSYSFSNRHVEILPGAMAALLLGYLSRIAGHGLYGGCCSGLLWAGRCTVAVVTDRRRHDAILRRMVLCEIRQS
jgi:hypothetical protein